MMDSQPKDRSPDYMAWGIAAVLVLLCFIAYDQVWRNLVDRWYTNPDMSHGFLVPVFAAALLWIRREKRPSVSEIGGVSWIVAGILILTSGFSIRFAGILYRSTTIEAWSLLPVVLGIVVCCGGKKATFWAWPSVVFLAFMLPLPHFVGGLLSSTLQSIAAVSSTYCLQVIGVPAITQGNIIRLSTETMGVAEACNGLRMLTSFFALSVAACFLLDRPIWQRGVLLASAPLIGVISNVFRITVTGAAYEWQSNVEFAHFVHDFAGWLMMPLAILLLVLEMWVLSNLLLTDDDPERKQHHILTLATLSKG